MMRVEKNYPISLENNYINVNVDWRAAYVDRSIQLQHWYKAVMKYETLFLSVYLVDKYLEKRGGFVDENGLNLLCVTALYTAGKYEDIWPPKLDTLLGSVAPQQGSQQAQPFCKQKVK